MTKYYADAAGDYIGAFDSGERDKKGKELPHPDVPAGAIEVEGPPENGRQKRNAMGNGWLLAPALPVQRLVTAEKLFAALKAKGVLSNGDIQ